MKKRSKLDLSGGVDQDKIQAAGFASATLADMENVQQATQTDPDLRSSQAGSIIKKHVLIVTGISMVPIPLFDLVALSSVQLKMLYNLTNLYEVPFTKNLGKSLITSLLGGVMPTTAAMTLASLAKAVPGFGTTAGMVSVSVLGSATTYAIGSVFMQHFESGGTLLDFEPKKMRAYFSKKLEEGKDVAAK